MDASKRAALLIDIVLVCGSSLFVVEKEKKRAKAERWKAQPEQDEEGEVNHKNNRGIKDRVGKGLRQGRPY